MRADKKTVDARSGFFKLPRKGAVESLDIGRGIKSARDAALIGDHHHAQPGFVKQPQRLRHARQDVEILPPRDVFAFRH